MVPIISVLFPKKTSIIVKLIIVLFFSGGLIAFALTAFTINNQAKLLHSILEEKSYAIARSLDAGVTSQGITNPQDEHAKLLKFIWLNPDVIHAMLYVPDGNNRLIAKVSTDPTHLNHEAPALVQKAFQTDTPIHDHYAINGQSAFIVFMPIHVSGAVVGVYEVSLSAAVLDATIYQQLLFFIPLSLGGFSLSTVFIYLMMRSILLNPIKALLDGVKQVSSGNLNFQVKTFSEDEMGTLAMGFNDMTHKLQDYNSHMENMVQTKTEQLNKQVEQSNIQNEQLQKINELMVNRELKMIELKEEIQTLKNQFQK